MIKSDLVQTVRKLRQQVVAMIALAGSGHPGSSLSCLDLLTVLYLDQILKYDPKNPNWPGRDYFVLSKGHAAPALYVVLAAAGIIDRKLLPTLRKFKSPLQGHVDRNFLPQVEASTGSLGQGLSIGVGMALGLKIQKKPNHVWVLIGDGEAQEGNIWEAIESAAQHKLDNLTAILDYNGLQIDGRVKDIRDLEPLEDKLKSFRWQTIKIDGHDLAQIKSAYVRALENRGRPARRSLGAGGPTLIIAKTIKGKGVDFMENQVAWHGKAPKDDEITRALKALGVKNANRPESVFE